MWELPAGKIQMAVILVYSPANPGNFETAARIALETLRVEPVVPRGAATPTTPGTPGTAPVRQAF